MNRLKVGVVGVGHLGRRVSRRDQRDEASEESPPAEQAQGEQRTAPGHRDLDAALPLVQGAHRFPMKLWVSPSGEGAPPKPALFLLPRGDVRIEDNWFTMGLAGTGSKNSVVADVFVPAHRAVPERQLDDLNATLAELAAYETQGRALLSANAEKRVRKAAEAPAAGERSVKVP